MEDNVITSGNAAVFGGATSGNAVLVQAGTVPAPAASPTPEAATQKKVPASAPEPKKTEPAPDQTEAAKAEPEPPKAETPPAEDIEAIKGENYALKAGVKPECAADAIALAKLRVKDGTTLEQAINEVVSAYPAFKNAPPTITPTVPIGNDAAAVSAAEDEKINRIMGIKPEKKGV